tara:strand:+ start:1420 stop:1584 length:165 start_codon:yes stop_codon:yes gene_type:complete
MLIYSGLLMGGPLINIPTKAFERRVTDTPVLLLKLFIAFLIGRFSKSLSLSTII